MKKNKITSEDFESNTNQDKETKKKSAAQKAMPIFIVAIVSLVVILVCVLIAYYQVYKSGKQNANILEGVYASSYYSMVDNVNNLSVDMAKYPTLTTKQAKLNNMQDMRKDCNYILAGLSILPIDEENVTTATKFFNQINGLCEAYSKELGASGSLSQEQELMFDKIALVLEQLKNNFNTQNYGMYDTNFNFVDATVFDAKGMNELSSSMGDLTDGAIEYPAMIFDGPFSTALETKEIKGLHGEISKEQAEDYLKNTVFSNRKAEVEYVGTTEGDLTTFDFEITIKKKKFSAQVSKLGGLLMTISSYSESGDPIMDENQAQVMASTFANNIGFENMESVWHETHENVVYVNLAPVVNGIVYYPDLVKVKIDLTSQDIVGFEAKNYAYNHVERNVEFNQSQQDAEKKLGFDYEIISTRKAVIRLDSGKEISTFEFFVERIDGMYFYYIDANNLEIAKVLKLVNVKNTQKLI